MAALCAAAILGQASLSSEALAQAANPGFSLEDRQSFYEQAKLSHSQALLYTALLPGLGNVYTEQTFSGVLLMTLYGMGWFMAGYGLYFDQTEPLVVGGGLAAASMGAAMWMSYTGVSEYNEALRVRYQLMPMSVAPGRVGVGLALQF